MNILKQIQQGDVWIEKVDSFEKLRVQDSERSWVSRNLSAGEANALLLKLRDKGVSEAILAAGEVTGHHHRLKVNLNDQEGDSTVISEQPIKVDMDLGIFELMEKAILVHEEHKPIDLEPGLYRFGIINEYDYESQQARRVWD